MRTAFIKTLTELARSDQRVNLVVADLGFSVVEGFAKELPDRFLNVGVAEQNLAGVAAGLSCVGGRTVFIYSIANFPVMRCLEQIRNDICFNAADVKITAVGGGTAYGDLGYSHYGVEDLAVMRSLPNMVVAAPADPFETEAVTRLARTTPGPWYIRLGKAGEPAVHQAALTDLKVGQAVPLTEGTEGTVIATGAVVYQAFLAVSELRKKGRNIRLLSMPFLKPFDGGAVLRCAAETGWILTVEEHFATGGLASAVSEVLAGSDSRKPFRKLHLSESSIHDVGSREYILRKSGLDEKGILLAIGKLTP